MHSSTAQKCTSSDLDVGHMTLWIVAMNVALLDLNHNSDQQFELLEKRLPAHTVSADKPDLVCGQLTTDKRELSARQLRMSL